MRGKPLIFAMCAGQVGNLLPHVVVPAVMVVHLIPLWGLTNAQAGLLAAAYAAGYMLAVPVLSSLTDRIDARRLLLGGSLFSAAATIALKAAEARDAAGVFVSGEAIYNACDGCHRKYERTE